MDKMTIAMALLQFISHKPNGIFDKMYVNKGGGLTRLKRQAVRIPYNVAYAAMMEWNRMKGMDGQYEIVEVQK